MSEICKAVYHNVRCTFRLGHHQGTDATPHSFYWIQREDEDAAAAKEAQANDPISVLIENIAAGRADDCLEAILAAAHGRKRAMRGLRNPFGRA